MAGGAAAAALSQDRLLLDEHYAARLAITLRADGHDVVALLELAGGAGLSDPAVYALAASLGRRIVTENVQDVRHLLARALHEGEPVAPLLLVHSTRFPRNRRAGGQLAAALRRWLIRGDQASDEDWLTHDR